jgi:hypothetical protein
MTNGGFPESAQLGRDLIDPMLDSWMKLLATAEDRQSRTKDLPIPCDLRDRSIRILATMKQIVPRRLRSRRMYDAFDSSAPRLIGSHASAPFPFT